MSNRDRIMFELSAALMTRAFRDLAASFAAVDADAADRAIQDIEATVAIEFAALVEKPPKGITSNEVRAASVEVIHPLREMTQSARGLIQQSGKPKH